MPFRRNFSYISATVSIVKPLPTAGQMAYGWTRRNGRKYLVGACPRNDATKSWGVRKVAERVHRLGGTIIIHLVCHGGLGCAGRETKILGIWFSPLPRGSPEGLTASLLVFIFFRIAAHVPVIGTLARLIYS